MGKLKDAIARNTLGVKEKANRLLSKINGVTFNDLEDYIVNYKKRLVEFKFLGEKYPAPLQGGQDVILKYLKSQCKLLYNGLEKFRSDKNVENSTSQDWFISLKGLCAIIISLKKSDFKEIVDATTAEEFLTVLKGEVETLINVCSDISKGNIEEGVSSRSVLRESRVKKKFGKIAENLNVFTGDRKTYKSKGAFKRALEKELNAIAKRMRF